MDKVDFDQYASQYDAVLQENIGKLGKDISYYAEHKIITLKRYLGCLPEKILEFGCGTGRNLPFLSSAFPQASVWGGDISNDSLNMAKENNPSVTFFNVNERPKNIKFDLVFISCVFHHIPVDQRTYWMRYIRKLLVHNGLLFIFEHNPLNPLTRHAVNTCPFDKEAILLWPKEFNRLLAAASICHKRTDYILFFPSAMRRLNVLEKYLSFIPLGGQYMVLARG